VLPADRMKPADGPELVKEYALRFRLRRVDQRLDWRAILDRPEPYVARSPNHAVPGLLAGATNRVLKRYLRSTVIVLDLEPRSALGCHAHAA
jgi:hypothetical protein